MILKTSKKIGDKLNIGVITWAFSDKVGVVLLTNFINILEPLSSELFVITGTLHENVIFNKKIHIMNIKHLIKKESIVIKIFRTILMQLRISFNLIKISKNIDVVIFFLGMSLTLPMIFAKLLRKNVILVTTSSFQRCAERTYSNMLLGYGGNIFSGIAGFLEIINFNISNRIVLYSPNPIKEWNLEKHRNKISIAHEHFLDFDKFKIKNKFDERENLVGYIGRLSEEKGVLNFVKSIPEALKERSEIKFLIGGDGQLRDKIERYLEGENLNDKVKLAGWIPAEEFSTFLNELKLFVLPSYTEGLPHTILEAMACGTPVLATPVGAISDVIKDGETGFIMENNSPECIAENIVRALAHPNINEITKNARALIEEKYNYQAAVDRYRIILYPTLK
ncbi:Trehalose synthase [ANME-1 cluster archaeon GoMg1]|nr:Trehalose synthase [ANME-1 cluster archaeon GoMg1]